MEINFPMETNGRKKSRMHEVKCFHPSKQITRATCPQAMNVSLTFCFKIDSLPL